jgi:hypothetical protein
MSKGFNRKPKAGEWSKYDMNNHIVTVPSLCDHFWQRGVLAEGWEKCCLCDLVRMTPGQLEDMGSKLHE